MLDGKAQSWLATAYPVIVDDGPQTVGDRQDCAMGKPSALRGR